MNNDVNIARGNEQIIAKFNIYITKNKKTNIKLEKNQYNDSESNNPT